MLDDPYAEHAKALDLELEQAEMIVESLFG